MAENLKIKSVKKGKNSMATNIIIATIVVALVGGSIFGTKYLLRVREYKKRVSNIRISNVDLSKVPDGSYTGSYDALLVGAKVQVEVAKHRIEDIKLIYHKNERGQRAEKIIDEITAAQSLQVDTITGATNSSKVILKAVENALQP